MDRITRREDRLWNGQCGVSECFRLRHIKLFGRGGRRTGARCRDVLVDKVAPFDVGRDRGAGDDRVAGRRGCAAGGAGTEQALSAVGVDDFETATARGDEGRALRVHGGAVEEDVALRGQCRFQPCLDAGRGSGRGAQEAQKHHRQRCHAKRAEDTHQRGGVGRESANRTNHECSPLADWAPTVIPLASVPLFSCLKPSRG